MAGALSAAGAVEAARGRAAAVGCQEPWFVQSRWDDALAEAKVLDDSTRERRPLHGLPLVVKANLAVAGVPTTAASAALDDAPPAEADASAVALVRAAGAIVVGTVNMDELAYGFTGRNAHHGSVRNPHDPDRLPGGSSSASAAAVAAGVVPAALGTDTNGSVRVPAALCGVWGLRPTRGRVHGDGVVPLAPTLDTPGPLAASAALLADVAAALGIDSDPRVDVTSLRAASVTGFPAEPVAPAVRAAVAHVAAALGAKEERSVPWAAAARAAAQVVTAVEGAAAHLEVLQTRADRIGPLVRPRLQAGALAPAAAYMRARALRERLAADVDELFAGVDMLVLPTVPTTAPPFTADAVEVNGLVEAVNAALGRCTATFSFLGLPALSVPFAKPADDGMPIGVQLVGRPNDDELLLAVARRLEDDGIAAAHVLA